MYFQKDPPNKKKARSRCDFISFEDSIIVEERTDQWTDKPSSRGRIFTRFCVTHLRFFQFSALFLLSPILTPLPDFSCGFPRTFVAVNLSRYKGRLWLCLWLWFWLWLWLCLWFPNDKRQMRNEKEWSEQKRRRVGWPLNHSFSALQRDEATKRQST